MTATASPKVVTFCGRTFSASELELMRQTASEFSALGVTEISRTVCELLEWKRPNGKLKHHECRQLLERLQAEGVLTLPALRNLGGRGPRRVDLRQPRLQPERPADAARLANSIRASPAAAGNAGGRTALSRNLLPGRQLDLRWADRRSRTNGPRAQSPRSSHQRYLRVPAGPRCPATPMRRARAVNKYGSNSQVIRGLVAQRVLGGPSRYQQGHSKLVPAGDVHRFSGQY